MTSAERARLKAELARVRIRRSREAPHSPSWAALDDWVDELEAVLGGDRATVGAVRPPPKT